MKPSNYDNIKPMEDPMSIFDLTNRVGLIIGGGGKMGRQFAGILGRAGAKVILSDVSEEVCNGAENYVFKKFNAKPQTYVCDISNEQSVCELFKTVEQEFGRLDFFISNVMGKPEGYYKPFNEYPVSTWNEIHNINLTGTFICCREASRLLEKSEAGSIVITSSIYGIVAPDFRIYQGCSQVDNPYGGSNPLTAPGAYASSKGGLIAFAKYLSVLLAPKHIRVNVLTPGGVYDGQEQSFQNEYVKRTPIGRMAVWSDYNGAILFLASDASRYMTGANLVIDGGWTAW